MIIHTGTMRMKPGSVEAAVEALRAASGPSRAEPGVLTYTFAIDIDDGDVIRFYEEYRDLDALASHEREPHVRTLFGILREHLDGRPHITSYEAVTVERG